MTGRNGSSRKYKCVFFDLDHTLWDYEVNSRETLQELFHLHNLKDAGVELEAFCVKFREVNTVLWELFDTGKITSDVIRQQRFKQILDAFSAYEERLCEDLSHQYLNRCPTKCNLIPGALETLDYLAANYRLTVVTNGFDEIQHTKLTSGNLHRYFDHIITSQKAGHRKPAKEIFEYALRVNDAHHHEAIMIGDNPITDIAGARNASIDAVLYNPEQICHNAEVHHEIRNLRELQQIL